MGRPVLVVTGRHRPHEIVLLCFAVVTGLAYTIGAPPPASAAAEMPPWLVDVWAIGLLAHGVIGLAGVLLPFAQERRLLLELGSMFIGTGALLLVTVVAFAYAGWSVLLGGGLCGAWAIANQARAWQILRDLRRIRGGGP